VTGDLGRLNDFKLSKLHADRLKQLLNITQRVNAVTEPDEKAEAPRVEDTFHAVINQLSNKVDMIAAAANSTTNRTQA